MKKKIIVAAVAAIVAVGAAWSFNQNSNESSQSDLTLSNIEAIASWEYSTGRNICSTQFTENVNGYQIRRCGGCEYIAATSWNGDGRCS